jgi:hypothetical protein
MDGYSMTPYSITEQNAYTSSTNSPAKNYAYPGPCVTIVAELSSGIRNILVEYKHGHI